MRPTDPHNPVVAQGNTRTVTKEANVNKVNEATSTTNSFRATTSIGQSLSCALWLDSGIVLGFKASQGGGGEMILASSTRHFHAGSPSFPRRRESRPPFRQRHHAGQSRLNLSRLPTIRHSRAGSPSFPRRQSVIPAQAGIQAPSVPKEAKGRHNPAAVSPKPAGGEPGEPLTVHL